MTITTMGWDVVYATTLQKINNRLSASGKLPTTFSGSVQDLTGSVTGSWGPWELISGSPSNLLWMHCPIVSGTFTCNGHSPVDLSGFALTVQFGLILTQTTASASNGTTYVLVPATSGQGIPLVSNYSFSGINDTSLYVLQEIMSQIVPEQVKNLGSVFASIVLNDDTTTGYPWLNPTSAAFACESLPTDDARIGIFALLAMTEGRSSEGNQSVVDRRVLDGAPAGSDGGLVLGPTLVMNQFLQPAIQGLVQGSNLSDFTADQTGTMLCNKETMTWGAFIYDENDDGKETATVYPTIPQGNIQLSLGDNVIHLSMSNINFAYPGWSGPGQITISFDTEQFFTFDFTLRDDGELVMVPKTGQFNTSFNVTIIPDKEEQIFQIALSAAMEVLMAVIGGVVECATEACSEVMENALTPAEGDGFTAEIEMVELNNLTSQVEPDVIQQVEEEAAEEGGEAVENSTINKYLQKFKNAIVANKYKIYMKIVEVICTKLADSVTDIAVWAAQKQYGNLPSLKPFAETGIQPVKWADGAEFKLTGGSLPGAMVLWGKLES